MLQKENQILLFTTYLFEIFVFDGAFGSEH